MLVIKMAMVLINGIIKIKIMMMMKMIKTTTSRMTMMMTTRMCNSE